MKTQKDLEKKPKVYAIIPARGGSKGIPRKNVCDLDGKPLIAHTILAALECSQIEKCFVTTEDSIIKSVSKSLGAQIIDRPTHLGHDDTRSSQVVAHTLDVLEENNDLPDYFVLLQPTSPLRNSHHIKACLDGFIGTKYQCALSVSEMEHHPYKSFMFEHGELSPLFSDQVLETPRQDLPVAYRQNGAIYVMSPQVFRKNLLFYVKPAYAFVMTQEESLDIDTVFDLEIAKNLMRKQKKSTQINTNFALQNIDRLFGKPLNTKKLNRDFVWRKKTALDQKEVAKKYLPHRRSKPLDKCPVCKSAKKSLFVEVYQYPFFECGHCGNIYLQTPPDTTLIKNLYIGEESEKAIQAKIYMDEKVFEERINQIARPKVDFVKRYVPNNGKWVDIGCGTGELLTAVDQEGWNGIGIEADAQFIEFARSKGLAVVQGFIPDHNINEVLKDALVVSMINVLEHVDDPLAFLSHVVKSIPTHSYVVFEVPRHPSLSALSNALFPDISYRHIYPPDHLNIFTEQAIQIMMDHSGLKPEAIWTFGQDFQDFIFSAATKSTNAETPMLERVYELSASIQQAFDENGLSDAMLIIAKKE